jgi:hypothetical protein
MTRNQRLAVVAVLLVVAVAGFVIARSSGGDGKDESSTTATMTTTQASTTTTRTAPGPAPPPVPEIRVRNGRPVGGVKRLTVKRGQRVRFVVVSDVEDHVHIHGYDLFKDVSPGRPARFDFRARIDGLFEVELEDRAEQIISLRVRP